MRWNFLSHNLRRNTIYYGYSLRQAFGQKKWVFVKQYVVRPQYYGILNSKTIG